MPPTKSMYSRPSTSTSPRAVRAVDEDGRGGDATPGPTLALRHQRRVRAPICSLTAMGVLLRSRDVRRSIAAPRRAGCAAMDRSRARAWRRIYARSCPPWSADLCFRRPRRPTREVEMASTASSTLQEQARRHLWLHFTRMSAYREAERPSDRARRGPVRLRHERQALPRLPGRPLHGADRLLVRRGARPGRARADAPAAVLHELDVRAPAAPSSSPTKLAEIAPAGINRSFFVSGGSEAVEAAWKLARAVPRHRGEPSRRKVIARKIAYHGTTLGALSLTGITRAAHAVRAARCRASGTSRTRTSTAASTARTRASCNLKCADEVAETSSSRAPRRSRW